jgi:radical SAM protein with 4Fe4S-binding SPASM domain
VNQNFEKTGHQFQLLTLSNPVLAYLEITYACEGRCPGCPSSFAKDRFGTMPGTQWELIIRELAEFLVEVRLTGGEPTLHPDFFHILRTLEKEKLAFKIYTNGLWPEPDALLETLSGCRHFKGFVFALHGSEACVHEEFTGLSDFSGILSNIRKSVSCGLPVYTSSVLGSFNWKEPINILKLAMEIGSKRHHFARYIGPFRGNVSLYREDIALLMQTIDNIPAHFFSYRVGECFPGCFFRSPNPCLAGITHVTMDPIGQIRACPFSTEILGRFDLNTKTPFQGIQEWSSDFHEDCLSCDDVESCMGGCRVMRRNFLFKRDPLMGEPASGEVQLSQPVEDQPLILNGRLLAKCQVRKENFGFLLVQDGRVVPVTENGYELLQLCDGTRNISDIDRIGGEKSKDFLISLYKRGCIELV